MSCSKVNDSRWVSLYPQFDFSAPFHQNDIVQFDKEGENDIAEEYIECIAVECSPPPTFLWLIGWYKQQSLQHSSSLTDDVVMFVSNDTQGNNETVEVEGRNYYNVTQGQEFR